MASLRYPLLVQWLPIFFQLARARQSFWAVHVLNEGYTGPANKDLGNVECVTGFVAYFCFGQQPAYSDYNSEEHVDNTVLEYISVQVDYWGQYLSCCPPGSGTNPGDYYRCNTWTGEQNDNCHTPNLPWNDGNEKNVGAQVPAGSQPIGWTKQWMYSFPAEGEGGRWWQGYARRIKMSQLADFWIHQAGGCPSCQGQDLEDGCFGNCINSALSTYELVQLTDHALADMDSFPNYGIVGDGVQGIKFWGSNSFIEVSGGNSAYGVGVDIWECNGLVNQAWQWEYGDYQIKLAGHNVPGMCLDLPGGNAYNGNQLWIWGCNGTPEQQWLWDGNSNAIKSKVDPNYCIDLPGGDTSNGNQLWVWQCNGGSSQKWYLEKGADYSAVHTPVSNKSRSVTSKRKGGGSWMHNMKKWLTSGAASNLTLPADYVPWYERKEVKDWYAAQRPAPGSGLPRPLVPKGWNGYDSNGNVRPLVLPNVTVLV